MFKAHMVTLSYKALVLILMLSAPIIGISLTLGLMVAIFQAATQIQEQNLAFTLKLTATIVTLMVLGNWLGNQIMVFAQDIFYNFHRIVGT